MPPTALAVGAFRPWILLSHAPLGAPLPCKRTNGTGYYLGRGKAPCVQVQVLSPFQLEAKLSRKRRCFVSEYDVERSAYISVLYVNGHVWGLTSYFSHEK